MTRKHFIFAAKQIAGITDNRNRAVIARFMIRFFKEFSATFNEGAFMQEAAITYKDMDKYEP